MMHVALCTDGVFPQAMGGMQRHSRLLAEHLARRGRVRLTVLHPHAAPIFDPALGIHEVHVPPIDTGRLYLRELWHYSGRMAHALDGIAPDVVLSQGFCVWKGMRRFSGRLIVHPHGLEMFQGITTRERILGAPFRWAVRHMVQRSAVVVSLGGRLTGILRAQAEGSACRVVTIPNAVEVPELPSPSLARTGEPLRLLFVGRFAFNKGLDVLLAVARRLVVEGRERMLRIQLAGDGPLMASLREMGVPPNVELLGRVDDAQLAALYRDCDAFVLPTRFEGMPTVVLEAMAQARPVFVSDVGATAEQVDGANGYLLPPGDVEALYLAIRHFAALPAETRAAMGLEGYQRVRERFSWPAATERFEALFAELA